MDKNEAIKIAKQYKASIEHKYNLKNMFLFGSYAKETQHGDSDIDIAVVLNSMSDIVDTHADLMILRRKIDLRIEPHPFYAADFNANNPMAYEILNSGIEL